MLEGIVCVVAVGLLVAIVVQFVRFTNVLIRDIKEERRWLH